MPVHLWYGWLHGYASDLFNTCALHIAYIWLQPTFSGQSAFMVLFECDETLISFDTNHAWRALRFPKRTSPQDEGGWVWCSLRFKLAATPTLTSVKSVVNTTMTPAHFFRPVCLHGAVRMRWNIDIIRHQSCMESTALSKENFPNLPRPPNLVSQLERR